MALKPSHIYGVLLCLAAVLFNPIDGGGMAGAQPLGETLGLYEDDVMNRLSNEEQIAAELAAGQAVSSSVFQGVEDVYRKNIELRPTDVSPADLRSLFYTKWQYALLAEAKRGFLTRPVDQAALRRVENKGFIDSVPQEERVRGIRELSLSGISYASKNNWTIWLNSQRMGPEALAEEILDIKVTRNYIDLKWFDPYTNMVYPIRLRPHERFNLDSRIFLPGVSP